jgi:hypothetical protein
LNERALRSGAILATWQAMEPVGVGARIFARPADARPWEDPRAARYETEKGCSFSSIDFGDVISDVQSLADLADRVELDAGKAAIKLVIETLEKKFAFNGGNNFGLDELRRKQLQERCRYAYAALRDGLEQRFAVTIAPSKLGYYQQSEPLFGPEIDAAFPGSIAEDISEAGKCLALDRATACVFHLMRVLDAAVQKLGDKLKVTIVDKNNVDLDWGIILANMKAPIEAMPKGPHKDSWSEALTLLIHVKQTWRHPTMHPKQTYTPEEAKSIFEATRSFMLHLATLV